MIMKMTSNLTFIWCLVAGAVTLAVWVGVNN